MVIFGMRTEFLSYYEGAGEAHNSGRKVFDYYALRLYDIELPLVHK